jgi:glycosyltransferase involved in cell wall biosynthesis
MSTATVWGQAHGSPYWQRFLSTSVVIVSHNEGANLRRTVHNLLATLHGNSEIIVVDDVSTDRSLDFLTGGYPSVKVVRPAVRLGVARARNLGADCACGHILVFSDAHMELPDRWQGPLTTALAEPYAGMAGPAVRDVHYRGMVGCGMTVADPDTLELNWLELNGHPTHPVPAICGMFMAMRSDVFHAVGGFDPGMGQWGSEDLELCLRMWLLGLRVMIVPEVTVGHLFRETFPYAVDSEVIVANQVRLGVLHLDGPRLERYLARLADEPAYSRAVRRALDSGVEEAARRLRHVRRYDVDWYMEHVVGHRPS